MRLFILLLFLGSQYLSFGQNVLVEEFKIQGYHPWYDPDMVACEKAIELAEQSQLISVTLKL